MKKIILFSAFALLSFQMYSQDKGIDLDVLRAPSSPASNLLGIATTDIDKPTDISSFMVSVQSASNSFTAFPSNYGIDLSPYYLFAKGSTDFTTKGLQDKDFKNIFKQTFVISLAISNPDSSNTALNYKSTYGGLGFKFSISRGEYDSITKAKLDSIIVKQDKINKLSMQAMEDWLNDNDENYRSLLKQREDLMKGVTNPDDIKKIIESDKYKKIEAQLSDMLANFKKSDKEKALLGEINAIAATFQTQRIGFSWDVNGGISSEFRNRNFENSKVYNAGIWTNFGYTNKKGFAFLGLIRYLYNPDKILALDNNVNTQKDVSTLDTGGRIAYSKSQSKFSCSAEAIYRSVLNGNAIDPSWKLIFNADYSILKNQKLTFSFGRDFDGTIHKDGNLIAALTLIAGFGNKK
ncbi:hypothetical protein [Flavobacterium defluvii]|uniref:DUF3078 domain-containing protein n=1 Tax=Flavobacterium defluvii TaxID=370979 RepID=A0A1M5EC55_9FLAO|nr:hypothetical protein [Flavobacterium defluvii]SHF76740.1 hypothetical protein SAMN05443663_10190 [Flavobacterium defluvii]